MHSGYMLLTVDCGLWLCDCAVLCCICLFCGMQWAAAALCNLSMHGTRVREFLVKGDILAVISQTLQDLTPPEPDTGAAAVEAALVVELLLGSLVNLCPHHSAR